MQKNVLWRIFFDEHKNWEKFIEKYGRRIRPIVMKEVEKFRNCGDRRNGFKLLVCEGCHDVKIVPYRCRSRFCTTCSCGEAEEWSRVLSQDAYQVIHRHVIFTIDEELRVIFEKHRALLKELMDRAARLIQDYMKKKHKVQAGIIAALHTFGARGQFNPHVHMMVTMGGMKENGEWKSYDFLPFSMMRKQWQTIVLKMLREKLSSAEKKRVQSILQKAWSDHKDGFYIYAPKQRGSIKEQLRYIGRYMRRPAIGIKRIVEYDGEIVVISYIDKKDGQEKQESMTAEEFIGRLIKHIPEENFKVIRHYGVYARRIVKLCRKLISEWQKTVRRWVVNMNRLKRRNWSERQTEQTGKDPRICPFCKNYYEYKGEVCLKEGQLVIRYADGDMARRCLERMIEDVTGNAKKEEKIRQTNATEAKYCPIYLFGM